MLPSEASYLPAHHIVVGSWLQWQWMNTSQLVLPGAAKLPYSQASAQALGSVRVKNLVLSFHLGVPYVLTNKFTLAISKDNNLMIIVMMMLITIIAYMLYMVSALSPLSLLWRWLACLKDKAHFPFRTYPHVESWCLGISWRTWTKNCYRRRWPYLILQASFEYPLVKDPYQ